MPPFENEDLLSGLYGLTLDDDDDDDNMEDTPAARNANRGVCTHTLQAIAAESDSAEEGSSHLTDAQRQERQRKLIMHIQLIEHASKCDSKTCSSSNCAKMKDYLKHFSVCYVGVMGGCKICKRIWNLRIQAQNCKDTPAARRPHPVPLTGVKVKAELHDLICEVKLSQCFHNNTRTNLECIYHFPIKDGAAICGFQAEHQDGSVVQGIVKEKRTAQNEYTQATKDGKQASLLEQVRGDVFSLKVGNLAVDAYVKITVTYVTTLETRHDHDSATAFVLPTSIAPRYIPWSGKEEDNGTALDPPQSTVKLFGLDVEAELFRRSTLQSIASPTHATELRATMSGTTGRLTLQDITMDRDLVILIHEEKPHQPRASLEVAPDGSLTGLVTFLPEIEFPDVPAREFVFVVDRSGSMYHKMAQARDTLLLFLRSLPSTCTFNIISFGSRFESLFPNPMPYDDETLETASQHVTNMQANFGGTEIVAPLQHVFHLALPKNAERQVFVLTDGQVSNDDQVFHVVRQNCQGGSSRLFSVGVGESVSRHLVSGMARAGRGTSCFVENGSADTLRVKVLGQLKQSLQPALDDVSIEWKFPAQAKQDAPENEESPVKTLLGYRSPSIDQETKNQPSALFYPSKNPPIFNKEKFLSYATFPKDSDQPIGVVVKCETRDGPLSVDLHISGDEIYQGAIAKKLAARVAITEFEERRKARSRSNIGVGVISETEALQLALSNGLASDLTSFIAVHEDTMVDAGAQIETRVIPQLSRRFATKRMRYLEHGPLRRRGCADRKSSAASPPRPSPQQKKRAAASSATHPFPHQQNRSRPFLQLPTASASPAAYSLQLQRRQEGRRRQEGSSIAFAHKLQEQALECRQEPLYGLDFPNIQSRLDPSFDHADLLELSNASNRGDVSPHYTQKRSSNLPPTDPVLCICLQQNAAGEFVWNDNLVATLGLERQHVKQLYEKLGSPDQKWFGTALAIAVLRRSFAAQHNVWGLQEQKALQVLGNTDGMLLMTTLEVEVAKMLLQSV